MEEFVTSLVVTEPPAGAAVSLTEAKTFLRVDTDDDDTLITALVQAATEYFQDATNRRLVTQTLEYGLDEFPAAGDKLTLPRSPVQEITSVEYVDSNGDTQTWSSESYFVDTRSEPARICPAEGESWPTTQAKPGAVTVTFVAGYEDDEVPESIKTCVLQLVAHWYEERQPVGNAMKEIPFTLCALILQHKVFSFGR